MYEYNVEDFERMYFRKQNVLKAMKGDLKKLVDSFYWTETIEGERFWQRARNGEFTPEVGAKLWFMIKRYEEVTGEKIIL